MRKQDDATVWIGYADFLMTVAVLFFLLTVSFASGSGEGVVHGTVVDAGNDSALGGCDVDGGQRKLKTDVDGQFVFRLEGLRRDSTLGVLVRCAGYRTYSELVTLGPRQSRDLRVRLQKDDQIVIRSLPGDALFAQNRHVLKAGAHLKIRELWLGWRATIQPGDVIAVQGHTDDMPFPPGSEMDNWMLSGQRAAAAARVLTDPQFGVKIPPCQVVTMGFGPSRPVDVVAVTDSLEEQERKRAGNRRIEFRMLRGTDISGGKCAGS